MSQSTEASEPRTPRQKPSSSSILAQFKSLTGSKSQSSSNVPSPSTNPNSPSPSVSQYSQPATSHRAPNALHGSHTNGSHSYFATGTSAQALLPPETSQHIQRLSANHNISSRIHAARSLVTILDQHQGADIIGIWAIGHDLIDQDHSTGGPKAGYELLIACIRHRALGSAEKHVLLQSISHDNSSESFPDRFAVLVEITGRGRNLESAEFGVMSHLLGILDVCYQHTYEARRARGRKEKKVAPVNESNLTNVFKFVLDTLKYNSKVFSEQDLEMLVKQLKKICTTTTAREDVRKSSEIIDALTVYSCMPRQSLQECVDVLCGVHASLQTYRDTTWHIFRNLLKSHLGNAAFQALLSLLKEKAGRGSSYCNSARGAVQIIRHIHNAEDMTFVSHFNLAKVISAMKQSLEPSEYGTEFLDEKLDAEVMLLILDLSETVIPAEILFQGKPWGNIRDILYLCVHRLDSCEQQATEKEQSLIGTSDEKSKAQMKELKEHGDRRKQAFNLIQRIADRFIEISVDADQEETQHVMRVFMKIVSHLNDQTARVLVEFYLKECLLYTFNEDWISDFTALLSGVLKDLRRSAEIRLFALEVLRDAYKSGEALDNQRVGDLLLGVIECVRKEDDVFVLESICEIAVDAAASTRSENAFDPILAYLRSVLFDSQSYAPPVSESQDTSSARPPSSWVDKVQHSLCFFVAKCLVRIFLRSIDRSEWKTQRVFECLLATAKSSKIPADARVVAFKALFRMRADTNHAIFILSATECEDVAALLCRTEETLNEHENTPNSPILRPNTSEDQMARRSNLTGAVSQKNLARTISSNNRSWTNLNRLGKTTPPLWLYPGPEGLPEEPPYYASHLITARHVQLSEDMSPLTPRSQLKIGTWLELLLKILQQPELEWEIFSYLLVHLGAQLTNHALFVDAIPQIRQLRNIICDQLAHRSFHEPPPHTGLRKADTEICFYHVLTMLISYHAHFFKSEQDDTVRTFVQGLGGERTTEICIHALSICCHELPASLTKNVESALDKMTKIITKGQAAVHILEFLATLARLPELYKNFREEEFKMVFGICFRYLEKVRDSQAKHVETVNRVSLERATKEKSRIPNVQNDTLQTSDLSEDLPQYVFILSFHVMIFWYMSLKLQDRPKHIEWIAKNLIRRDADGNSIVDEQAQVTIDMMHRISYSDRDETGPRVDFAGESHGTRDVKSWIVGTSILTIETAARTGLSQITRRRPSGTRYSIFYPQLIDPPRHQVPINIGLAAETYYTADYVGIRPEAYIQEFYSPLSLVHPTSAQELPVPLPSDEATQRALEVFDRISPLDGHKAGIIYVGEAQEEEHAILANVMGSADYTSFLRKIGFLAKLKGAKFNTQGLDREHDTDGEFTFAWRDRVSELVFHVTTMMPTMGHDSACVLKKRHIGNDLVNIIFNNSGKPWKIDNIPSAFNYFNIVITPEARASFVETRLHASAQRKKNSVSNAPSSALASPASSRPSSSHHTKHSPSLQQSPDNQADPTPNPDDDSDPYATLFYKVTLLSKTGIPPISPAAGTRILSGAALPAFVRLLALNASVFAQVWAARDAPGGGAEHISSWRSRLREINKLRDRHCPRPVSTSSAAGAAPGAVPSASSGSAGGTVPSMGSTGMPVRERESMIYRRASKAHIFGGGGSFSTGGGGAPPGQHESSASGGGGGGASATGGTRTSGFSSSTTGSGSLGGG